MRQMGQRAWGRVAVAGVLATTLAGGTVGAKEAEAPAKAKEEKEAAAPAGVLEKLLLDVNAEPDVGTAPLKVEFSADTYEGDEAKDPVYTWDFGDGSPEEKGAKVKHTYKKPGDYEVEVRVKDATGRRGSDMLYITVEEPEED